MNARSVPLLLNMKSIDSKPQRFPSFGLDKTKTSCSESSHNGVEMKITVEKEYFEAKFPSRVKDFDQIDGFYKKIVYQDQMQIEFENENCK